MSETRLHLGCGSRHLSGYTNIDADPQSAADIITPIETLPYADESVDIIYASHVLEHFGRQEITNVLAEWYRVLRKGGMIRLAVPDFEAVVEHYSATRNIDELLGLVCGGQRNQYDFHKMIFDQQSLTRFFHEAGFASVEKWDWKATEHADMDDYSQAYLPHMDKENGRHMSLNLTAVKA